MKHALINEFKSTTLKTNPLVKFKWSCAVLAIMLVGASSPISARAAELIVNGGFESGSAGWTLSGASSSANGGFARSGSYFCWFGGADSHTDFGYQTIAIPAGATTATLSFYYNINSLEGNTVAYDTFSATIRDSSGGLLATVVNLSNRNQDPAGGNPYYHQQTFNLLPYAGATIRIYFSSATDAAKVTNFRVDDVSVQVIVPTVSAPTVQTLAATSVTSSSAQLHGTVNPNGATTTAYFQYGTTTSYGGTTVTGNYGSGTTTVNVPSLLSSLGPPGTVIHYRLVASNSGGTSYGSDLTFQLTPSQAAPTVQTLAATSVTSSSAQLHGTVNPNGATTTAYFQYGTTTSYGGTTVTGDYGSGTTTVNVPSLLSSLGPPGTVIHYRLVASNSGGTSHGSDLTFQLTPSQAAPTVQTLAATSVTSSTAQLHGTVNPNGATTTAYFQYGLTTSYGGTTVTGDYGSGTTIVNVPSLLSNLGPPGTVIHYRLVASNSGGTSYGSDLTFQLTPSQAAPLVQTLAATSVTSSSAQLHGTVNPNGATTTAYFQYGLTTSYGGTTVTGDYGSGTTTVNVPSLLSNLGPPGTVIHYRIVASNSGGTSYGSDLTFQLTPSQPALTITTTAFNPATATVGTAYAALQAVTATGGQTPYHWSASGLPSGMAINASSGAPYGTPTVSGTFNVTVTVTDSSSPQKTDSKVLSLIVSGSTLISVSSPNGGENWTAGTTRTVTWSVSGTPPTPISYFWIDYSLNNGNSWFINAIYATASATSASWNVPSGIASALARIRVRAINSSGVLVLSGVSANNFTISQLTGKPTAVPDASNRAPVSGESVNFTGINSIRATAGCAINSYAWNLGHGGQTASGVSVNHVFPLSTSGSQNYTVQLTVTDCNGQTDTKAITITVTGRALGTAPDQSHSADPVNLATGNYTYERTDLKIPGKGIQFELKRFYNSKAPTVPYAPLGTNWTHSYNLYLASSASNSVIVTFGDGHNETYATNGAGGYFSEPGVYHVLTTNGNGTFTLTTKEQLKYNFNAQNRLATMVDKNGNTLTLNYSASGNLTNVIDTVGRAIQFTFDGNNRITQIADSAGRTVKFTNDVSGDLISATDPNGNTTRYGYDSLHQMTNAIDPKGNVFVRNFYDAQRRVVNSQKDALGYEIGFAYDFVTRITTVTNTLGQKSYHQHDEKLRIVSITDELGNAQSFEYDDNNNRTKVIDKNGFATTYAYDAFGNVTSKSDPVSNVTGIEYNNQNNPVKRTNALAHATAYAYNAAGNLTRTTNALGLVSSIGYDTSGLPLVLTNANGHRTTNTFDAQGNLLKVQDTLGNLTAFAYDTVGRKLAQTNANNKVTRYFYDNNDNLLRVIDPLNRTNTHLYDANNNRIVTIDARGAATTNTFDAKDRLLSTRNALGGINGYEYDALDRKTKVTDARGGITRFGYDAVGNLIAMTNALNQTTRYTYDANGNQTSVINALNQITTNFFDTLNRLVQSVDPLGQTNRTVYDALGRRIQAVDALNRTNVFTYDSLGRLTQTTDANAGTAKYSYDNVGNRLVTTDPNNQSVTNIYNVLNRLIQTREAGGGLYQFAYDGAGNLTNRIDPKGQIVRSAYDGNNRRTSITYPSGTPVALAYDPNGNLTNMTDSVGTTTYQYDALNRLVSVTDAFGKTVSYGYDPNGNRVSLTYPGGKTVTYGYDSLNRMISVTDWLNGVTTYAYDAAGDLVHTTNPNTSTAHYRYDTANRLTGLTNTAPNGTPISSYSYTLDAVGNHTQVSQLEPLDITPVTGQFSYTYDADNRLISAEGQAHSHDANGNMTALNATNLLSYDFEDRLTQTVFGETNQYQYDGAGNRKVGVRSGVVTRYVLDLNSSLSQVLAETDGGGNITAYYVYGLGLISQIKADGTARYYHFDSRGSTIAMTDTAGAIVNAYSYDPFGRIRDMLEISENRFRYLGRHGIVDECNGFSYIRARYYSARHGRFITKDPLTGKGDDPQSLNRYIYALNNPVRLIDISGLSPQEVTGTTRTYATSDTSLFHNYLISPTTGGYANSTVVSVSRGNVAPSPISIVQRTFSTIVDAIGRSAYTSAGVDIVSGGYAIAGGVIAALPGYTIIVGSSLGGPLGIVPALYGAALAAPGTAVAGVGLVNVVHGFGGLYGAISGNANPIDGRFMNLILDIDNSQALSGVGP